MSNNEQSKILAQEYKEEAVSSPAEVKANRDLDKKRYNDSITPQPTTPTDESKKKPTIISKLRANKTFRKIFIVILALFTGFVLCLGSLFFLTVTNLDTSIFKITLKGVVTDRVSGEPVEGAQIYVDDEFKATTNADGTYAVTGLGIGNPVVKITKEDYQDLLQQIPINRLFLNYTTTRNFELIPKERAAIQGRLLVEDESYVFADERIIIDGDEYTVSPDGTYRIDGIVVGQHELIVSSLNYADFLTTIDVQPGINEIKDISLTPAGDIEGSLKSYVKEDIVSEIQFNIENVDSDQIVIGENKYKIKDLEIGREYSVRVVADGYLTRDYKITIQQGLNQLFDFKLVEEGKTIFFKEDPETEYDQFFSSDFDGLNQKKLTNYDESVDVFGYYYNGSEDRIYFQSDKEDIRAPQGQGDLRAVYQIDLATLAETRVTQNTNELGSVTAIYTPNKLVNVSRVRANNTTQNKISVMDFSGNNRTELKTTPNSVDSFIVSDDGRYLYFKETIDEISSIYRIDIASKQEQRVIEGTEVSLFDTSSDGQTVLYARLNPQTTFIDLFLYNFGNQELRTLDDNHIGESFMFIDGTNDEYMFFMEKSGVTNIFKNIISANKEEMLTDLEERDEIQSIFQQNGYVYYQTQNALYILDISKPYSYKLVYSL